MTGEQLPCPHGRQSWGMCPHCLGTNSIMIDEVTTAPTEEPKEEEATPATEESKAE